MEPHDVTSRKPRKPRSDSGPRLTERDRKALAWIGQQYAARLDQLQVLLARLGESDDYARKPKEEGILTEKRTMYLVKRWEQLGLACSGWFLHGDPPWIWLSMEGLRAVRHEIGELRRFEPTPGGLSHLFFCNRARLFVEERKPDGIWQSERQLRAGHKPEQVQSHLPDGLLILPNGHVVAVEIELSVKGYARLEKILRALASQYQTVWYFCTGRSGSVIKKALETLPESFRRKILIYSLDDFTLL
jgi:hypothetical protein